MDLKDNINSLIDLISFDYEYYNELRNGGVNEKNAKIRATLRGLFLNEIQVDFEENDNEAIILYDIIEHLVYDEYCKTVHKKGSTSFRSNVLYTKTVESEKINEALYDKFGLHVLLTPSAMQSISDYQLKREYSKRFDTVDELEFDVDFGEVNEVDLDDELVSDDELDLDLDDELDLILDDLDLDDDPDLDLDGDLDIDDADDLDHNIFEDILDFGEENSDTDNHFEVLYKPRTNKIISRFDIDKENLDDAYFVKCLNVIVEYHKENQFVAIPLYFFPQPTFQHNEDVKWLSTPLTKTLVLMNDNGLIDREKIKGHWNYKLNQAGKDLYEEVSKIKERQFKTISFRKRLNSQQEVYDSIEMFSNDFNQPAIKIKVGDNTLFFKNYDEIVDLIKLIDKAAKQGYLVISIEGVYDGFSNILSNVLKSHYFESSFIEQRFIKLIEDNLNGNKTVQMPIQTFADKFAFGLSGRASQVIERLLKKKLIKKSRKNTNIAYSYSLLKPDELDFDFFF